MDVGTKTKQRETHNQTKQQCAVKNRQTRGVEGCLFWNKKSNCEIYEQDREPLFLSIRNNAAT